MNLESGGGVKFSKKIADRKILGRRVQVFRQRNRWIWGWDQFLDGRETWWLGPVFMHVG